MFQHIWFCLLYILTFILPLLIGSPDKGTQCVSALLTSSQAVHKSFIDAKHPIILLKASVRMTFLSRLHHTGNQLLKQSTAGMKFKLSSFNGSVPKVTHFIMCQTVSIFSLCCSLCCFTTAQQIIGKCLQTSQNLACKPQSQGVSVYQKYQPLLLSNCQQPPVGF